MQTYFFDVDDGEKCNRSDDGIELADRQQARAAAIAALPDIARDVMPDGDVRIIAVQVRDDTDTTVLRATLSLKVEWLA